MINKWSLKWILVLQPQSLPKFILLKAYKWPQMWLVSPFLSVLFWLHAPPLVARTTDWTTETSLIEDTTDIFHSLFVHPPSFVMALLNSFDLPKFPVVLQPWTIVSNFDNNDNLHLIFERPTIHPNITMGINNLTHSFIDNQTDIFLDPNFFILSASSG